MRKPRTGGDNPAAIRGGRDGAERASKLEATEQLHARGTRTAAVENPGEKIDPQQLAAGLVPDDTLTEPGDDVRARDGDECLAHDASLRRVAASPTPERMPGAKAHLPADRARFIRRGLRTEG
jgi:hypothetical protein